MMSFQNPTFFVQLGLLKKKDRSEGKVEAGEERRKKGRETASLRRRKAHEHRVMKRHPYVK